MADLCTANCILQGSWPNPDMANWRARQVLHMSQHKRIVCVVTGLGMSQIQTETCSTHTMDSSAGSSVCCSRSDRSWQVTCLTADSWQLTAYCHHALCCRNIWARCVASCRLNVTSRLHRHPTTPHHTTPRHTTPHHTTPHHTTLHYTPHHTTPHHSIPYHTIPYFKLSKWDDALRK